MTSKTVKIALLAVSTVLLLFVLDRIIYFDINTLTSIWQIYVMVFLYLFWRLVKAVEENRIGG
ncbi:hypothetical protein BMS3Abin16_01300 [archaeon BMS3Abin16]|nr:hypothetical protein BMS3Abin16_01300 [archaeon BMS3Abin16]